MYLAVFLMYFISAAVILLALLALIYNKNGRASVLCSLILVLSENNIKISAITECQK